MCNSPTPHQWCHLTANAEALQAQINGMIKAFVQTLPALVIAILVLVITWIVARFAVRIADRLTRHTTIREDLKQLLETLVRLVIWVVGIMVAATIAMPGMTPASLFAGLGIGATILGRNLFFSDQFTDTGGIDFNIPWMIVIGFLIAGIGFALLMTWVPARRAASVPIAEALRYE